MAPTMRQRHKPASLIVQITQAELRVLHHRQLVGVCASKLGQDLREQLTSPAMLLLAGGLGFVAGHMTRHQASTPSNAEHPRAAHTQLLAKALKLIAFARTLSRIFPSAAMEFSVQSESSSQTPAPQFRSPAA
jgi:hypothetical protein